MKKQIEYILDRVLRTDALSLTFKELTLTCSGPRIVTRLYRRARLRRQGIKDDSSQMDHFMLTLDVGIRAGRDSPFGKCV